jgi:MATE family, multidrug efflux pump
LTNVDAVRPPSAISVKGAAANFPTDVFLHGPIIPTLVRLSWLNILVMLAQASTGLVETWWVIRLGTDALAGND